METFIVWLFGTLVLPVVLIAVLASIMGIRPEAILMPVFGLFGALLRVLLELVTMLIRVIGGVVMVTIARIFNAR